LWCPARSSICPRRAGGCDWAGLTFVARHTHVSRNAELRSKPAVLPWALAIALLTALGLLTAFLRLAVLMPWLA
jgi:hypothetical protein